MRVAHLKHAAILGRMFYFAFYYYFKEVLINKYKGNNHKNDHELNCNNVRG